MRTMINRFWAALDRRIEFPISPVWPVVACGQLGILTGLSFIRNIEMIDSTIASAANLIFMAELFLVGAWLTYRIFYVPQYGTHHERVLSRKRLALELRHPGTRVTFLSDGSAFFTERATGKALGEFKSPLAECRGGDQAAQG